MGKLSRLAGSLLAVGGLAGCGMAACPVIPPAEAGRVFAMAKG